MMKIIDTFPFFNELEVLKMRFELLYDHVDHFVIVESNQTFTLKHSPKELSFWENRGMFEKYLDKVVHVPMVNEFRHGNPWANEYLQRDSVKRGLDKIEGLSAEDIVLLSDVDEIPDPEGFSEMKEIIATGGVATFEHKMYRYYINMRCTHELWKGTRALFYETLCSRFDGRLEPLRYVNENFVKGGWHYTGVGGLKRFIKKMESFSHADICDTPKYTDEKIMKNLFQKRVLDSGRDVHHFNGATYELEKDPSSFLPKSACKEDYSDLIYKEGEWK